MSSFETVILTQERTIASITLHRPQALNAINNQMVREFMEALDQLSPDVRVLIVRGAGNQAFAAGGDLVEMQERTMLTEINPYGLRRELTRRLELMPIPTVAALNGVALGGGFEIALACHLRIAAESAQVGLPELRVGLIPGNGGTQRLLRLVGRGRALQAILLSERISAREAERLGLVNWVVPDDKFDEEVNSLAQRLAALPRLAVRGVLESIVLGEDLPLEHGISLEQKWFAMCQDSPDKREGVSAFLQKRQPRFE